MPDREKAIRILEGNYKSFVLRHKGELITVNELLALLKAQEQEVVNLQTKVAELATAQEPRVMTLAEAVSGDECWLECVNGVNGWCDCVLDYDNPKCVNVYRPRIDSIAWVDKYGKTWRCWTSRPTDTQREAEPWTS